MNPEQAGDDLEAARRSYSASVHPVLPSWAPPLCGLLVAGAITLAGMGPAGGVSRLVTVVGGVVLAVAAAAVVLGARRRQGIRGVQGPARDTWVTLFVCGVAFLVSAVNTTAGMRWVYVGLGVVVGVLTSVMVRKAQP